MKQLISSGCRAVIGGVVLLASAGGCMEEHCTVIQGDTAVFAGFEEVPDQPERLPRGEALFTLRRGDRARVLWRSNLKDQLIYEIETTDGRQGYIFHEPGIGRFSMATECRELKDPEAVKRYLPDY